MFTIDGWLPRYNRCFLYNTFITTNMIYTCTDQLNVYLNLRIVGRLIATHQYRFIGDQSELLAPWAVTRLVTLVIFERNISYYNYICIYDRKRWRLILVILTSSSGFTVSASWHTHLIVKNSVNSTVTYFSTCSFCSPPSTRSTYLAVFIRKYVCTSLLFNLHTQ